MNFRECNGQLFDELHFLIYEARLDACNGYIFVWKVPFDAEFELVEESERGSSLFIHDLVGEFGIENHFEKSETVFNLVEIMHLGLFVGSKSTNKNKIIIFHKFMAIIFGFCYYYNLIWDEILLFGKCCDWITDAVVGEDLSEKVAICKISLKTVNSFAEFDGFVSWRGDCSSNPI